MLLNQITNATKSHLLYYLLGNLRKFCLVNHEIYVNVQSTKFNRKPDLGHAANRRSVTHSVLLLYTVAVCSIWVCIMAKDLEWKLMWINEVLVLVYVSWSRQESWGGAPRPTETCGIPLVSNVIPVSIFEWIGEWMSAYLYTGCFYHCFQAGCIPHTNIREVFEGIHRWVLTAD